MYSSASEGLCVLFARVYSFLVFQYHMQKFTTFIVDLMKKEKLFASQGGPIILAQARITLFLMNCQNFSCLSI